MSVMAVELGASRLLAPYFSSSQIVWTIIIGTIMIAMALGNIYGGKSADKNPNPDRLYIRMIIAALWIAAIPFAGRYIIVGISALLIVAVNNNFLIIAAFTACMVIFVFPLFLLGTVTPSLARYTVDSLDDSGKTVGTLGAFNTVGSIIGTFLPTFVTIPAVGTSATFLIFAGILLLLSLIYFLSKKEKAVKMTAAALAFVILAAAGARGSFAFWDKNLTYEGESVYNYLQVKEDGVSLFGFLKKDDLDMFRMLITVNGIGPKAALSILSAATADQLRFAVLAEDMKAIEKIPGIGKKTAGKLILELKDKLRLEDAFEQKLVSDQEETGAGGMGDAAREAVEALAALGYPSSDALKAVRMTEITPDMTAEEILRLSLKNFGK